jgi:hypothetical protein
MTVLPHTLKSDQPLNPSKLDHVVKVMDKPDPVEDRRSFLIRLFSSIRPNFDFKKKEISIKGGAKF